MSTNVKERIKIFLSFLGVGQNKFEESVGLSNGYINNVKSIGSDKIIMIIKEYPQLNIEWLLTGEGSMLKEQGNIINNSGIANTGSIGGNVTYNQESPCENTKDINTLFTTYNDNKGVEIDRLQVLYATMLESKDKIISEKNTLIEELKEVIKDLRNDKKQLTSMIENNNKS